MGVRYQQLTGAPVATVLGLTVAAASALRPFTRLFEARCVRMVLLGRDRVVVVGRGVPFVLVRGRLLALERF